MLRQGRLANPYYQAQAMLARRDHSTVTLTAKLRRQGFSAEQVRSTVARLQNSGLLNDERFTGNYIDAVLRRKPVGPLWLQHKLRQQGIEPELITAALHLAFPPGREEEIARRAAAAWRRLHPSRPPHIDALARFLASRGFSAAVISACHTSARD